MLFCIATSLFLVYLKTYSFVYYFIDTNGNYAQEENTLFEGLTLMPSLS